VVATGLVAAAARAAPPAADVVRAVVPPVIDGRLDDPAWREAAVLDGFRQVEPVEGGPPSERTEVLLLYDADFLYVAFRCLDRDPDAIVGTQMRRDADLDPDDRVRFVIDTFLDRRNGFLFEMNPVGAKSDALVENNTNLRRDWDGIWYGRASIDDEGWVAEMAIPAKTISFDPAGTRWGFNAERFIRRRNEQVRWASPSQNIRIQSVADAGIIEGLEDLEQGIGLDVKPFGLLRYERNDDRDRERVEADAGVDLFYKLSPASTLAITVNTDFAETEVDERRINLTRFPLFFPEKRDFFLQDAGIFSFGGIFRNPLPFQSRRIGLGPGGEVRDILAGAKLTGRFDDLNVGILDVVMQDDDELGQKNFFVARPSLNVLDESSIGAIVTSGDPDSDGDNTLAGADFNYRTSSFDGDKVVEGNLWLQYSDTTDAGDDTSWGFKLRYPNDRIRWDVGYTRIGDEFEAALGFVPRPAIHEYFGGWRYRWRPADDRIRRIDAGLRGMWVTDLDDRTESQELSLELLEIETEAGDVLTVEYDNEREVLVEPFEIFEDVTIPVGDYRFQSVSAGLFSSEGRPVSVNLFVRHGEFYSGHRTDVEVGVDWRASRHLTLGVEYEQNDVDLDEGDFTTRVARGRANVFFTPDLSWQTFAQYDNVSDTFGINSRVRWIIEPGREIFFVVNHGFTIDDDDRIRSGATEITTKLGWTFRF
jgi:hypothetical protein